MLATGPVVTESRRRQPVSWPAVLDILGAIGVGIALLAVLFVKTRQVGGAAKSFLGAALAAYLFVTLGNAAEHLEIIEVLDPFEDYAEILFFPFVLFAIYGMRVSEETNRREQAQQRIKHLNAVLKGIRNVNQLITREKDRDRLIRRACKALVEARGFHSSVIGLLDPASGKVTAYAGEGQELEAIRDLLERGEPPDCAKRAVATRDVVVISPESNCIGCTAANRRSDDLDTVVMALEQDDNIYGFLMVSVAMGMGFDPEEQGLLREAAGDIAFALRSIELQAERDESQTALADTEEQLRQIQKLDAIGQLAGGVAHDFNNILMAQLGYCDLMEEALREDDPLASDLAEIRQCAERAASLTRQLLAFSRRQPLQPEVLDVNELIANTEKMLQRLIGEHIELSTTFASDLGKIEADPGQIEQVIVNLAVNARDAMPDGGRLSIETANVHLDEDYVGDHVGAAAGPHVMLAVSDTGCGMDANTRTRLFEPFFTTKQHGKGTGLGLATVYGIVKQSGGNIWVYSELGKGATFKVYLPQVEAEPAEHAQRRTGADRGKGEFVLVVEDEHAVRVLLGRMIDNLGYRVHVAANGGEALLAVEEQGLRPDLLITDVVMPGMAGPDLATRLARTHPTLKTLFMSGYTDNAVVHHGILDRETPFIQKPFNIMTLAAKIREVLDSE